MIIELLGPSIEQIFSMFNKKFSLKTVIDIAYQMVIIYYFFQIMINNSILFSYLD